MAIDPAGIVSAARRGAKLLKERRNSTRTLVSGVFCDRGQVIDLSERGVRLITHRRWSEAQARRVTMTADGTTLTLVGRCVWCRQDGMFTHAVGLAFDQISAEESEVLSRFASLHTVEGEKPAA